MDLTLIVKLIPMIISLIEIIKRIIPDNVRTYANPVLAVFMGIAGSYYVGGNSGVVDLLTNGLAAGVGAVGAYKIPKELASRAGMD